MAYQTINSIFQQNESDLSASEAHGLASGLLCIENNCEATIWLTQLFSDEIVLLDEDKTVLVALFEQTRKLLNDEAVDFRYDLFLPGGDESLTEQIEALRLWCEGFLFGIGYSSTSSEWPEQTGEIMKDIVEFTKMDAEINEQIEEDEFALMEIQEYLRAAVILLKDQLFEEKNGQGINN